MLRTKTHNHYRGVVTFVSSFLGFRPNVNKILRLGFIDAIVVVKHFPRAAVDPASYKLRNIFQVQRQRILFLLPSWCMHSHSREFEFVFCS